MIEDGLLMECRITQALTKLFDRHRIVFWNDTKQELRSDYEAVSLPEVQKLELSNNEFGIKHRILRSEGDQKFLIYREGPAPDDLDNWLLDLQLAHVEFRADKVALWLADLELGHEFTDIVQAHEEFFKAAKRKDDLKGLLSTDDTPGQIRLKMLAVCVGSKDKHVHVDEVVRNLLQEMAEGKDEKFKLINRCGLDEFLWEQLYRLYEYHSEERSLKDFQIRIFHDCYEMDVDPDKYSKIRKEDWSEKREPSRMSQDIQVFLKRWKDSRVFEGGFEDLSADSAEALEIEQDLAKRDFRELIELDYFQLIDQKIISDLVRTVAERTIASGDVSLIVRQRRQGHWYRRYSHLYEAIDNAAQFTRALSEAELSMESLADGVQRYSSFWFQIDQLYRKFTYHVRMSGKASLMSDLTNQIENLYTNDFLLKLGDRFQTFVDTASNWEALPVQKQKTFFFRCVEPFLSKDKKVCVIISDAMRYEIGDELLSLIRREDRYTAQLEPALSMLPSYTQLGMAALLPNKKLSIADNDTGTVLVDGQSSQGKANRSKILARAAGVRATAYKAEDLMSMKGDDCRALVREHDLIYVYHNRIDATGDKRESEERVFEAVEETLQDLIKLIKKLTGANINNLVVTSDHGFIYQNRAIEESDFAGVDPEGEKILYRDRRFVLGKGLAETASLHKFTPEQLGLTGEVEVQIPKSINRLRLKGSGSRFVHGGASLQEVVIPVLKINKKRQSDVSLVDVDILRGATSVITSGQVAVTLYQTGPVTDKIQQRVLSAGIYTEAGELISDSHELTFDLRSDNPRDRELPVRFVLTRDADKANGQEVILKLREKVAGTSHSKEYKSLRYMLRRSFTSDFDF